MTDNANAASVDAARRTRPAWWVRSWPRVGVSSCLLGEPVRFNGGHKEHRFLTEALGTYVEWVPVCPEVEVGMGTPRDTVRLVEDAAGPRMVAPASGRDYTREMTAFAGHRTRELGAVGLSGYILKSKSPSCGLLRLPVYAGDQVSHREGRGLFAAVLATTAPLLAMEEEVGLDDPDVREGFVERVFAHARLRELFEGDWRPRHLADFHARHELQLMAHDPAAAKRAGQVLAVAGARSAAETERDYGEVFLRALAVAPTRDRHVDALQHTLARSRGGLADSHWRDVLSAVTAYRDGEVALSVPVAALRHHALAGRAEFVREQTYLDPFPAELRVGNHASGGE